MSKFRKRPVVIDAVEFHYQEYADNPLTFAETPDWLREAVDTGQIVPFFGGEDYWYLHIKTLEDGPDGEAKHVASPGDWIVRGVQGELYPVKPIIFRETYEPVET